MGYSIDSTNQGCYEGTTCLINKLGIKDELEFSKAESAITFAKASLLEQTPLDGLFDFEHYKAIHKFLFEDLFDWAGQIRTINLSKKGTVFVPANEIESISLPCFSKIAVQNYFKNYNFNKYVDKITELFCDINMLHPFREGNGRTQRAFFTQLIRFAGHDINFADIDSDLLMITTIQASGGVTDNLRALFLESIIN
jgi:cell filamentation protein